MVFGGAITAHRLTELGIEATILEKGKRWHTQPDEKVFSPYIYPDGRSTWLRNFTVTPVGPPLPIDKYTGVLEGHFYHGMRVLTGAAYGGGSIVYGGLHVKPNPELFNQIYPDELSFSDLEPYFDRVGNMLEISPVPEDIYQTEYYTHYRVMESQSENAGIPTHRIHSASDWDIVRSEIAGDIAPSVIHGEAVYGVNSGAKMSLDKNYLYLAEQSGYLEVKTLRQVVDIGFENEQFMVSVEKIDEKGRLLDTELYRCNYLFLTAGSVGTSSLLVKARAKNLLGDLNQHVGEGWGNNGNVEVLRSNVGEYTGRWQGGPPAAALLDYDNPLSPLFIEHPQFPLGINCNCLLYFGIGINPTRGHFLLLPVYPFCASPLAQVQQSTIPGQQRHALYDEGTQQG